MFTIYGRVFCVSPLQIATADTDAMAAIEICMKQEEMSLFFRNLWPVYSYNSRINYDINCVIFFTLILQ